jgi:flagellar hook-basal body complex protein FliE
LSNLNVETLSSIVTGGGNAEELFHSRTLQPDQGSERKALQEMGGEAPGAGGAAPLMPADGKTFSDILTKSFEKVNEQQHDADQAIKELVSGRTKNIHETLLTVERADASLKLAMQVRNKILDAYREIMRMQV